MTKYRGIHPPRNSTLAQKLAWFTRPSPDSDCLMWIGATTDTTRGGDHGIMRWDGKNEKAHRLAWIAKHGPIPDGQQVLHRCDVPRCVNPDHLWLGTHDENMADMLAKGRARGMPGIRHHKAKLSEAQILMIRADKRSGAELARVLGVTRSLVNQIRRGEVWTHI